MDRPNLIKNSNPLKRMFAIEKFKEYKTSLYLNRNHKTSLLYVGCGNGKAMIEDLVPLLPSTITKIVGSDIDEQVIKNARKQLDEKNEQRISFKQLDLLNKNLKVEDTYDHIISFWCLRWVHDISVTRTNIKNLLNSYGSGLFVFEISSYLFNIILMMGHSWKPYKDKIRRGISPFQFGGDIIGELKEKIIGARLYCEHTADLYREKYKSFEEMKEYLDEAYTFRSIIPADLYTDFYNIIFNQLKRDDLVIMKDNVVEVIEIPVTVYTFLIRKPLPKKQN